MDRKFQCRFFGYVELGMSLSEITDDYRQKILKLAISKLYKNKTMNDDEIEIAAEKMKLANVPTQEKRLFKAWKKIKKLKIEVNAWNITILNDKEGLLKVLSQNQNRDWLASENVKQKHFFKAV